MKIVYCGNFIPEHSTENDVKKAIEYLGHEVCAVQENSTSPQQIWNEVKNSDLFLITSTWDEALNLNEMLNMYKLCAESNIPTATLHLDTFWPTKRDGRLWWLNPMFHTAYIFTADGDWQDKWKLLGKNHIWLPPAIRHDAVHYGTYDERMACDVAFVGSNGVGYHEDVWPQRKELVDAIRGMCQRNGWSFKNPGGDNPKINRDDSMNNFYASAKVTVGDSLCIKKEDAKYWSDRVPEATGRGGFLIMPEIKPMQKDWPDLTTFKWGDYNDLEHNIKYYLDNELGRDTVRRACHERTKEDHTYVNRVQTIIKTIEEDK